MNTPAPRRFGFTLVELMITVLVMSIVAGMVLAYLEPTQHEQLYSAANLIVADLGYARNLAVTNNSNYRVKFDTENNRYVLDHIGTTALFDDLPDLPFRSPSDAYDEYTTDLDELPFLGASVEIVGAWQMSSTPGPTVSVEYDALGGTTTPLPTTIWLGSGHGSDRRYISVLVNPTTGLATIGPYQATEPPAYPAGSSPLNSS